MSTAVRYIRNSPLWQIKGFSIQILALDLLHNMDLGVIARFIGFILWAIIDSKALVSDQLVAMLNTDDCHQAGLDELKRSLNVYYDTHGILWSERIWDITLEMLGNSEKPMLSGKGMESRSLIPWIKELLDKGHSKFAFLVCSFSHVLSFEF